MFFRMGMRVVAMVLVMAIVSGCAEFDRRGGVVAEIEDWVLFTAHTKSHRLFRSYMLIGVLLAAGRQAGHNKTDAAAIEGNMNEALASAYEAYECLYRDSSKWVEDATKDIGTVGAINFADPAICQFFDEKMARLDYALYRLALSSLFNEKTSAQLTTIRDKLIGEVPVLSAAAKSAIFGVKALNQATNIADDLLNLSFSSAGPVLTLLPLYRDALELNMWVIVDTLTRSTKSMNCSNQDGTEPNVYGLDCRTGAYALYILNKGNGYLPDWRNFVRKMNGLDASIEAYAPHFALVSRLIWRSCLNLLDQPKCTKDINDAAKEAQKESLTVTVTEGRTYRAAIPSDTRFVRQKIIPPAGALPTQSTITPRARDPEPTGSIGSPKASAPAR